MLFLFVIVWVLSIFQLYGMIDSCGSQELSNMRLPIQTSTYIQTMHASLQKQQNDNQLMINACVKIALQHYHMNIGDKFFPCTQQEDKWLDKLIVAAKPRIANKKFIFFEYVDPKESNTTYTFIISDLKFIGSIEDPSRQPLLIGLVKEVLQSKHDISVSIEDILRSRLDDTPVAAKPRNDSLPVLASFELTK